MIEWCFRGEVDVAGNEASGISKANLKRCGNSAFVVAPDIVVEPNNTDRLSYVSTSSNEVERHVASSDGDMMLEKEENVSNSGYTTTSHGEGKAVFKAICGEGCG